MANVEIRSVYLGVSGGHIRGFNNRGVHPVVSADREISTDDVDDVVKNAKAINLPAENTVIHAVRQHFFVDGQDGVTNPVGMLGARLEVDMHVIHGHANRLQNVHPPRRKASLEVDEIVFNGIASSLALLTSEQKELGALVIDIGGGTTEYVGVFRRRHPPFRRAGGRRRPCFQRPCLRLESAVEPCGKIETGTWLCADGRGRERPDHQHHQRTRPRTQARQRRAFAAHHVAADRGNISSSSRRIWSRRA